MNLSKQDRLGPYEIVEPLGAGGMGEVYRARDERLGRDVAVKVLPAALISDVGRLRRFEQEARITGSLNHPNILAVYDVGTHEGRPYLVCELLSGETLRERMAGGALPVRRAVELGIQIARGLAAAHERGIVHRDLKPENLFVTEDGQIKILDFGLAKAPRASSSAPASMAPAPMTHAPTLTEPGVVLGTVGYMCPEQVRGKEVDDDRHIFAFGAILYEMLTGSMAFRGSSAVETMAAILNEDPQPGPDPKRAVPPALERIARRCIEKSPAERFQSARDVAFALDAVSGLRESPTLPGAGPPRARRRAEAPAEPPSYRELTFQRGVSMSARFTPDGQTIVYSAAWGAGPLEVYTTRPESPESRSLGILGAEILAISPTGEMALSLDRQFQGAFIWTGTLARAPFAGGAPREILENVQHADWSPDGTTLAIVREMGGVSRLELPIGRILDQSAGWISHPRIAPDGGHVAFLDHPLRGDDAGSVGVVDVRTGEMKVLSEGWLSEWGLAWPPKGSEVWFTAVASGNARALHAVSLSGRLRLLARTPKMLTIHDVSRDGRALVAHNDLRVEAAGLEAGATSERNLSWLDWTLMRDLSEDGKVCLFDETGEGGGRKQGVYLRRTDGSPAIRLGDGAGFGLSPDGKWAGSYHRERPEEILLLPTGAGQARWVRLGVPIQGALEWLRDARRIVFVGREPGHGTQIWLVDLGEEGKPTPVSMEGCAFNAQGLSPDETLVAGWGPDLTPLLFPLDGGDPRPLPGADKSEIPFRWNKDGSVVYTINREGVPAKVHAIEVASGKRTFVREILPGDPAGVRNVLGFRMTADASSYVYSYPRNLSSLYLVEGLR